MTTKTPWAHLPNARHIDAVLADVEARPDAWDAAWDSVRGVAAWRAARQVARGTARRHAAWTATWNTVRATAQDSIRALIAWDSSADLLDLSPDVLRTMIDLAPEPVCHQAALLLPWAIVRAAQ